jgi:hypothetical protein
MSFETPTTHLEAVNAILASVGESPVNALGSGFVDAEMADQLLQQETKLLLTSGCSFNEDTDVTLAPDSLGKIHLPTNCLRFTCKYFPHYIKRGSLVYDRQRQSTTGFTSSIKANLVVLLPFEDIPEAARLYLTIKSARKFSDQYQGDGQSHQFLQMDELSAYSKFCNDEAEAGQYNMLSGNYTVQRIRRYR